MIMHMNNADKMAEIISIRSTLLAESETREF
jgi:hypothetical protein